MKYLKVRRSVCNRFAGRYVGRSLLPFNCCVLELVFFLRVAYSVYGSYFTIRSNSSDNVLSFEMCCLAV